MRGMVLDQIFVERGVSGSVPLGDRPQGRALLALVQPGDAIVTPKLDRMFRSALDALAVLGGFRDKGVALHMVDLGGDVATNGISKLVFTILSAVAEAERDRTRERIAEVKRDQKARNRYLGGVTPFGWRVEEGGELVPVPDEQEALGQMHQLRAEGLSLRMIADRISANGRRISHVSVKNLLAAQPGGCSSPRVLPDHALNNKQTNSVSVQV